MGHDRDLYPMQEVMDAAELASGLDPGATTKLKRLLKHQDNAVRYWAALGFLMRGEAAVADARNDLTVLLNDPKPAPRIAAAEALGRFGNDQDAAAALTVLMQLAPMDTNGLYVSILALNAIDALGARAKPVAAEVAALPVTRPGLPAKLNGYVPQLIKAITARAP
jgi:uncharacterized sulfatase